MRSVCTDSSVVDYKARIACNDEYGGFALSQDQNYGTLVSVNSRIEPWYLNSKSKFHDHDWYVGEPCIAQFWHDGLWYRGIVTQIAEVRLTTLYPLYLVIHRKQNTLRKFSKWHFSHNSHFQNSDFS